ncbi:DUF1385 domain-containing protein [Candidatus Woesearchaeota archaeon]|nr:DUF1385 domain-containing protein [Candidatus Woesearchaeota archaeon]
MNIGGQAVIEGVMMRNKEKFAVAVRLPNGKIKVKQEKSTTFPKFFNIFFIRGVVGLGYSLYDGIKALAWSGNQQMKKKEKLTKKEMIGSLALSFAFAIILFVAIPFFTARWIQSEGVWFNVLDGLFRLTIFLGYLAVISMMSDVKRLFQYHGAEHKTIFCYEAKQDLTVDNVKKFVRFHPRCGTSFLVIVVLLSIVLFSFIEGAWWVKFLGRIVLLPALAGVGYEMIKLSSKYQGNVLVRGFTAPGLWVQRITTKEPDEKQLEVAIKALKAVM